MADHGSAADDIEGVARADRFFEALAIGAPVRPADRVDDGLARLFADWRDDVRHTPAAPGTTVTAADAIAALESDFGTRGAPATTRRPRVALRVLGSVAAALLIAGGVTVAVFGLGSDSSGGPTASDDQVVLAAQTELRQVEELINTGRWDQAQERLSRLDSTVQTVSDPQARLTLDAWTTAYEQSISERRPAAPLPPTPAQAPPPGITIVVPPSATTSETSATAPSGSETTGPGSTTTAPQAPGEAPATTAPTTTAQATTAPTTTAPPTAPPATTTPATTPPTTTAPPTSAAPQATSPVTPAPGTVAEVPAGPPPGPAPAAPGAAEPEIAAPSPAEPPAVGAPVEVPAAPVEVPAVEAPDVVAPAPATTTVPPAPAPALPVFPFLPAL